MNMVYVLSWSGRIKELGSPDELTLKSYQKELGGYIRHAHLKDGRNCYIRDFEPWEDRSPFPMNSSVRLHAKYSSFGNHIHPLGNVVIFSDKEWREMV